MWKIEKIVSKGEYNYAVVKAHPNATSNGYVLEHRVVVENHLNRLLDSSEVVHHLNGDKKDNRIENLEIMTLALHSALCGPERNQVCRVAVSLLQNNICETPWTDSPRKEKQLLLLFSFLSR